MREFLLGLRPRSWEQGRENDLPAVRLEAWVMGKMTWVEISMSRGGTGLGGNVKLFKHIDFETRLDIPVSVLAGGAGRGP